MNDELDEILNLFELEVESQDIGTPTFPTLTKKEAKAQLNQLLIKERLDELDILRNGYGWGDALETSEWILDDRKEELENQLGEKS